MENFYKVAICDDEEIFLLDLKAQITELLRKLGVPFQIRSFSSGEALLTHLETEGIDFQIIFLDIFMNTTHGVEIARTIRSLDEDVSIVFTTFSDQYAIKGYEVRALQYLLKPIEGELLLDVLKTDIRKHFEARYYVFKAGGSTQRILFEDILYFESELKFTRLVTTRGIHKLPHKISDVEHSLPRESFWRCHKGFIIHFRHVAKKSIQQFTLFSGTEVPIGKTYAKTTTKAFLNYIGIVEEV